MVDVEAGGLQALVLVLVARPELPLHRAAEEHDRGPEITPSGVPPMPMSRSTPVPGWAAAIDGATSPSRMRFRARAGFAKFGDEFVVPVALEHDDRSGQ